MLPILGVQPALGRSFSRTDDSPAGAETVMLTHGYWQAKFGGDRTVVGRRLLVNGRPRDIIGVLPSSFHSLDLKPAIVLPMRIDRSKTFLGQFSFHAVARLKADVAIAQANADAARMIPIALKAFPPFPGYSIKMFEEAYLPKLWSIH